MSDLMTLRVPGARLRIDARLGHVRSLAIEEGAHLLEPLHAAPWLDDPDIQADDSLPMVERRLAGDFFCAPHGWGGDGLDYGGAANSVWEVAELVQSGQAAAARLRLTRTVQGAVIEKELRLRCGEPILYQSHRLSGGEGALPVANHPMLHLERGGRLCFSPKRGACTPDQPLEPGRHWLDYPAAGSDLSAFPGRDGAVDLHRYPEAEQHEDMVALIEADGNALGWTAVIREAEDDIVFVLKDPAVLPVTLLWYSNGGRIERPFNGRHRRVLGIADGCTAGGADRALDGAGVATHLTLGPGREHVVRHAIGAVRRPRGWMCIADVAVAAGTLTLTEAGGETLHLPFDAGFFSSARAKAFA
ncbi:hypothetical protein Ga0609869_002550 [Rhodovulum iodosum]|uniref:DUF4432 family protein n=1 Tax=Rhodovulum iodosum TaxID=68291 RepID=A0ABV3XV33_9RHOB|nr:hypothetical protein [Rhodovulum robiginosum]RSK33617.1 hypothetical protein EJA01_10040 [Rhodovulum robiginosum]